MQLEQLVGSNSFGSAIKQPMVLRQLDALSLLLLLTWCLSPFGSQALQRAYRTGFAQKFDTVEVYYLDQTGSSKVFASDWNTTTTPAAHAADNQMAAVLFLSTLVPADQSFLSHTASSYMDAYYHPLLGKTLSPADFDLGIEWDPIAGSGLPIVLPDTELPQEVSENVDAASLYEYISFNVRSSYFDFVCGNWSIVNITELTSLNQSQRLAWSSSYTLGMRFTNLANTSNMNHLLFASANLGFNSSDDVIIDRISWNYSFIQCDFQQHYIDTTVYCDRWPSSANDISTTDLFCLSNESNDTLLTNIAGENMGTHLEDFSDDWTAMAAPRNPNKTGASNTPSELPPIFIPVYIKNEVTNTCTDFHQPKSLSGTESQIIPRISLLILLTPNSASTLQLLPRDLGIYSILGWGLAIVHSAAP